MSQCLSDDILYRILIQLSTFETISSIASTIVVNLCLNRFANNSDNAMIFTKRVSIILTLTILINHLINNY